MQTNKDYFKEQLKDLEEKTKRVSANLNRPKDKFSSNEDNSQFKTFLRLSKEINQAVHQECIKALAFSE